MKNNEMKSKTKWQATSLKRFISYIYYNENELVKKIKDERFFIDNSDIMNIFKVYKDYYLKFYHMPTPDQICELVQEETGFPIELSLVKNILNKESLEVDITWLKNEFTEFFNYKRDNYNLLLKISKQRGQTLNTTEIDEDLFEVEIDEEESDLKNTPFLNIYDDKGLPKIIKEMLNKYDNDREKDVFFTSLITTLSSVFPNVYTLYGKKKIYPNLFTFITAPASSFKGIMIDAKKTLNKYDTDLREKYLSTRDRLIYEIKEGNEESKEKLGKLMCKYSTIPGNSSTAALVQQLENQDGNGYIFQSEADSIVDVSKNEWGNYSELLRSAFHHEEITVNRKKTKDNDEPRTTISFPKISMCISGTPDQVIKLIQTSQNGLFSRFLFYSYENEIKWVNNMFDEFDSDEVFGEYYSDKIFDIIEYYSDKDIKFNLTKEQQDRFNKSFEEQLDNSMSFNGKFIKDSIFRNGVRFLRIAMILSLLDEFENIKFFGIGDVIQCKDDIFNICEKLIKQYTKHTELIFNNLNKNDTKEFTKSGIEKLFDSMPSKFKKSDIITAGKKVNICEKTINRFLTKQKNSNIVEKIDYYTWEKTNK